ncbi:MAG: winged helix-turn-helix domain-containing protein [Dehalococcoidia bacterium]|nr:winged helix-turn-helix domain-containing protein [Dehalococcoidia bacterium]
MTTYGLDEEPLRGYVAGTGPLARRARRMLREIGWKASSGRSLGPGAMPGGQGIDLFLTTEIATDAAHQHALSWAALDGVAVVGLAERGDPGRLLFFDAGADDVWDADLPAEEAQYRLAALMRRMGRRRPVTLSDGARSLTVTRATAMVDGRPLTTTPIRHRLLYVLADHAPHPVQNHDLARLVWGHRHVEDAGFVHTQVSRLRRELAAAGLGDAITTCWGIGYTISAAFARS